MAKNIQQLNEELAEKFKIKKEDKPSFKLFLRALLKLNTDINESVDINNSIEQIVKNKFLQKKILEYLINSKDDNSELLRIYEMLTSKNFLAYLQLLKLKNSDDLYKEILSAIITEQDSIRIAPNIYIKIYEYIVSAIKETEINTSTVVLQSRNSNNSEVLKELDISSYISIINNFNSFKIIDKDSASNSIIFTANLNKTTSDSLNVVRSSYTMNGLSIYFKLFPTEITTDDDEKFKVNGALIFEEAAYVELFKLVKYNITPNILCTAGKIDDLPDISQLLKGDRMTDDYFRSKFIEQVVKINENYKKDSDSEWTKTSIIMTQSGGDIFRTRFGKLGADNQKKVLFQLFYTLYVFGEIEFSHGDLHFGNMFIVDVPETELVYLIFGTQYRFKTIYLLKIYDFDRGNICKTTKIKVNKDYSISINETNNDLRIKTGNYSKSTGLSTSFNNKADITRFLLMLNHLYGDKYSQLIDIMFPGLKSKEKIKDTYKNLLKNLDKEVYDLFNQELNKIFDKTADFSTSGLFNKKYSINYKDYDIDRSILEMTWSEYFDKIKKEHRSHIIKSPNETNEVNNLWIPSNIVIPISHIFMYDFFKSLESTDPIDMTKDIVYSLDDRIIQ